MNSRFSPCVFLALLIATGGAAAQGQGMLRGLSEASATVSHNWTEADERCGIRESEIKPIVSKALTDNALKVVDDSAFAELLVTFSTLETEGTCVTQVRVGLRAWATATLLYDPEKEPRSTQVLLREESAMLLSPASQHGQRFRDRVRTLAERLASAVRIDNQ